MAKIQLKEDRKTEIETDKVKNDLIQNLRVEGKICWMTLKNLIPHASQGSLHWVKLFGNKSNRGN